MAVVVLVAAWSCYKIYDGIEDQWNITYYLEPAGGATGSCTPPQAIGNIDLVRIRTGGMTGSFEHGAHSCSSSTGSIEIQTRRDPIVAGDIFEEEDPDSLEFAIGNPNWLFRGSKVGRHFMSGNSVLTVNDSVSFRGWWQAERR